MSEESATPDLVELTRRAYEWASARDWDALLTIYGSHSVWDTSPMGLGTYEGPAAIRAFCEDWVSAYEEYEIDAEEIVDLGHGIMFAAVRQSGRPVDGSGYVQLHYAAVVQYQQGMVAWITNYADIDEARAAAERLAEGRG